MAKKREKDEKLTFKERVTTILPEKPAPQALERKKAEKDYQKVDEEQPDQSIYVKKTTTITPADDKKEEKHKKTIRSETYQEIEEILSEGLEEIYQSLDEREQREFRRKGEETATKLEEMIKSFKVKVKEVLSLIKDWFFIIPRLNKYFLEQQSKIKTDRIMALAKEYKKKNK